LAPPVPRAVATAPSALVAAVAAEPGTLAVDERLLGVHQSKLFINLF
jgi:hypothetical protein